MMKVVRSVVVVAVLVAVFPGTLAAQQLFMRETDFLRLIYYSKSHEYLTYHLTRAFENSLAFDRKTFDYTPSEKIVILLQDFGDYGHGGTSTVPWNYISIGLEPFDYVFETMPANERMNWLMNHELIHVVATDKAADGDITARKFFHGKVAPTAENPMSMFYSYLTSPRWYAPRWYHEGIAVFMETWESGGLGRVLGGYDEMVFRTMVDENAYFYDVVGLQSEGTAIDFQVGQNAYLYGTRFDSYLADKYGPEKLLQWVNRNHGSRRYFSAEFREVYGVPLDTEWQKWIAFEHEWQKKNLALIRQYPVTPETRVYDKTLGSVSRSFYDPATSTLYAGIDFPGRPAHIVALDMKTHKAKTLCEVNGPALYYVTSLAYDPGTKKLFFTTDNSFGWRDINEIDLRTGRHEMVAKDVRTGDLVVNPVDHSLWGVQHNNGLSSLVRFDPPYHSWKTLLTLDYGRDMFDLDISPDGKTMTAGVAEINGDQKLVAMKIADLLEGKGSYDVLHVFENDSPENFTFTPDGRYLYGTSYYTGVSNVFRYDFETGKMDAITNAETGLFRPIQIAPDELLAYHYTAKGFVPVTIPNKVVTDVNAIHLLGQDVFDKHPELANWNVGSPARVDLDKVTRYVGPYKPFSLFRLGSMYPVVEGYKDSVAYGMRFNIADPMALHTLNITAAYTPDRNLDSSERFHLKLAYDHAPWKIRAKYNGTDFYDLFGPTKSSRKGHSLSVGYENYFIYEHPRTFKYSFDGAYYGGIDTLPEFQNIAAPFSEYATAEARLDYSNTKKTIGAVDDEKGVEWSLATSANYVNSAFFPQIYGTWDYGFILPGNHWSLWMRTAAGKSFGSTSKAETFANFFFGGFGNNWVDHQAVRRYREFYAFPGVDIDAIGGTDFGKGMIELDVPPLRFRRVGIAGLYCQWARLALFGTSLTTDISHGDLRRTRYDAGAQVDFSIVMFSNLDATVSVGYAKAFDGGQRSDEFMASLKLLK